MAIKKCSCKSLFQDRRYGKGRRVHNLCSGGRKASKGGYRCTVCGKDN